MKPLPVKPDAPKTFDEACELIKNALEPDDVAYLQEHGAVSVHFSLGMWLRNNWGLWDKESPLGDWFRGVGLGHADDMSGCLLAFMDEHVNGREYDIHKSIKMYRDFWLNQNIDPIGGVS